MGNLWQPHQRDNRGFFARNAGKLLIWAFLGPVPIRMFAFAIDANPLRWVADILFFILIFCAIGGYIARRS